MNQYENYPDWREARKTRRDARRARRQSRRELFMLDNYSSQPPYTWPDNSNDAANPGQPYPPYVPDGYQAPRYVPRPSRETRQRMYLLASVTGFLAFSLFLVIAWLAGQGGYFWPAWIIVPWAIALANQAAFYFLGNRAR